MLQPDGTVYFYTPILTSFPCAHSFLYVVWRWNENTPAFCGLCFLTNLFQDEVPKKIHEHDQLAENGNPETTGQFLARLQSQLGLREPPLGQPLNQFRHAREQNGRRPSKKHLPATHALWQLFGYQPRMAKPLLRMILGETENEIARQTGDSIYNIQTTVAKGIRTALRYVR